MFRNDQLGQILLKNEKIMVSKSLGLGFRLAFRPNLSPNPKPLRPLYQIGYHSNQNLMRIPKMYRLLGFGSNLVK